MCTCNRVFLIDFKVFGNVVKQCLDCSRYIFSFNVKIKEKMEK